MAGTVFKKQNINEYNNKCLFKKNPFITGEYMKKEKFLFIRRWK